MAKQVRSWNPGDAANAFVRVVLSEVGRIAGGLSDEQWTFTRDYFGGRCAYSGQPLSNSEAVREHAVPINREHCGVHAYGNVLPSSKAANDAKGRSHYRDYMTTVVKDRERLERIERFVDESGYADRIAPFGDLRRYCEQQYRVIVALGEVNRGYLRSFVAEEGSAVLAKSDDRLEKNAKGFEVDGSRTLPIQMDPSGTAFREQLVANKQAWLSIYYGDGRIQSRRWDASRISPQSNIIANLRSRPDFRNPKWRELGITQVLVTIDPVFILTLEASYYGKGFFNVPIEYDRYVGEGGSMELILGGASAVAGRINRTANQNGTARISGGAELRDWFKESYSGADDVPVRLRSPHRMLLG